MMDWELLCNVGILMGWMCIYICVYTQWWIDNIMTDREYMDCLVYHILSIDIMTDNYW
jgi:hypothetical protein